MIYIDKKEAIISFKEKIEEALILSELAVATKGVAELLEMKPTKLLNLIKRGFKEVAKDNKRGGENENNS